MKQCAVVVGGILLGVLAFAFLVWMVVEMMRHASF